MKRIIFLSLGFLVFSCSDSSDDSYHFSNNKKIQEDLKSNKAPSTDDTEANVSPEMLKGRDGITIRNGYTTILMEEEDTEDKPQNTLRCTTVGSNIVRCLSKDKIDPSILKRIKILDRDKNKISNDDLRFELKHLDLFYELIIHIPEDR
ncbi:MAG: hypothetical protein HRU09_12885 [Oligoflexales bacterium]|nr:hypothetical protein [Oligoflexales bacterium]